MGGVGVRTGAVVAQSGSGVVASMAPAARWRGTARRLVPVAAGITDVLVATAARARIRRAGSSRRDGRHRSVPRRCLLRSVPGRPVPDRGGGLGPQLVLRKLRAPVRNTGVPVDDSAAGLA